MSDIVGYNEPLFKVACNQCKHYLRTTDRISCKAYDNIPHDILRGVISHDTVLPGQKGAFIFEPEEE